MVEPYRELGQHKSGNFSRSYLSALEFSEIRHLLLSLQFDEFNDVKRYIQLMEVKALIQYEGLL